MKTKIMPTTENNYPHMQIRKHSISPTAASAWTHRMNGRNMAYGDRVFVRLTGFQQFNRTIAEFTLTDVRDMCDVYGAIRKKTRGLDGLAQLYVRNVSKGWSIQQPFKLYSDTIKVAASVTHPIYQPEPRETSGRRQIPESIRMRYGLH